MYLNLSDRLKVSALAHHHNNDIIDAFYDQEVAVCLKEVQSPSVHYVFVDEILNHTMDKKASDRNASGKLLHFLLRDGVLTAQQYLQG